MKKLLLAMFWMFALSVAIFGAAAGLVGMVFMRAHAVDVIGSAGLSFLAAITGAYSAVGLSVAASDAQVEAFTLIFRVRNWWRRRSWRPYAAALAGESTAASYGYGSRLCGTIAPAKGTMLALAVMATSGVSFGAVCAHAGELPGNITISDNHFVDLRNATRISSFATSVNTIDNTLDIERGSVTMTLGRRTLATSDGSGVHLARGVDIAGQAIATISDLMVFVSAGGANYVALNNRLSQFVTFRELDRREWDQAGAFVYGSLFGGLFGALVVFFGLHRIWSSTFAMRRWIARAERSRMKREAEQGALR